MDLIRETDLASVLVSHFDLSGWDVYQEVAVHGGVADIVAVRGKLIWVVETKMTLSLAVMEQAYGWIGHAHFVSVAIPYKKHRSHFAHRILRDYGIGLFLISSYAGVQEVIDPRFFRKTTDVVRRNLCEEQKTFAPAGSKNGHWTPFKQTVRTVLDFVRRNPGATFTEMIGAISTHYRTKQSARANLLHWIESGVIRGVDLERVGKSILLYPAKKEEEGVSCLLQ